MKASHSRLERNRESTVASWPFEVSTIHGIHARYRKRITIVYRFTVDLCIQLRFERDENCRWIRKKFRVFRFR